MTEEDKGIKKYDISVTRPQGFGAFGLLFMQVWKPRARADLEVEAYEVGLVHRLSLFITLCLPFVLVWFTDINITAMPSMPSRSEAEDQKVPSHFQARQESTCCKKKQAARQIGAWCWCSNFCCCSWCFWCFRYILIQGLTCITSSLQEQVAYKT